MKYQLYTQKSNGLRNATLVKIDGKGIYHTMTAKGIFIPQAQHGGSLVSEPYLESETGSGIYLPTNSRGGIIEPTGSLADKLRSLRKKVIYRGIDV